MRKNNTVIYLRVSTDEQIDNFSLETQLEICQNEADRRKLEVVKIFREEGKSAKNITGRPTLVQLLAYCRKNKNSVVAVIVYRIDRLSRQIADYLAIRKKLSDSGVTLYSATEPTGDSPTEKLVETMLAGFAQLDNDIRSERSSNGMKARFLAGHCNGKPPLGYLMKDKVVVKDPETWDKVKASWDLMATGTKSLKDMANYMNDLGLRHKRRAKSFRIRPQSAGRIFRHKFYTGILTSKTYKLEVQGQHSPMISQAQFDEVQDILDGRNVRNIPAQRKVRDNTDFPLRRIVKCGKCGSGLTGAWSKGRKAKYPYYRCGKPCNSKSIRWQDVHNELINVLRSIEVKPQTKALFEYCFASTFKARKEVLQQRKKRVNADISKFKESKKTIVKKNLAGIYSDEIYKEQMAMVASKLNRLTMLKQEQIYKQYDLTKLNIMLGKKPKRLDKTYQELSPSQIRVFISLVFQEGLTWEYEGKLRRKVINLWEDIEN